MSPLRSGSDLSTGRPLTLVVSDSSQVGEARRLAVTLAHQLGFAEEDRGKVALVVTEAATNLLKHAQRGEILLQPLEQGTSSGLQILALDRGPGMTDLGRCLQDGVSSTETPGTGLGAIGRLSGSFTIHTQVGMGTALLARLWSGPAPRGPRGVLEIGTLHLPKPTEQVCGDAWAVDQQQAASTILVTDGLGHGPLAASAAQEAVRVFRENVELAPGEILQRIHGALRSTRGAAVAVARLDLEARQLRFAGVGNIAGTIFAQGASQSTMSHNGTVGHEVRKIQELPYSFPPGALLVLHTDGLATHWRLDRYAGLATRPPTLIASVLYRDFSRGRDDVTVLVARESLEDGP